MDLTGFKQLVPRRKSDKTVARIGKDGRLQFTVAASTLLGDHRHALVYKDDAGRIAVVPAAERTPGAYRITRNGNNRSICTSHAAVGHPPGTVLTVEAQDGGLLLTPQARP